MERKKMTMPSNKSEVHQRDLQFPSINVTVMEQRIESFGPSFKCVSGDSKQNFRIKATVATTKEQARRAIAENRILRRLPEHPNILKMIDSGCSASDQSIGQDEDEDTGPLEEQRVYCLLFKDFPSRSVRDIMEKHRRKFERCLCLSDGTSQGPQNSRWMKIETVMGIFRQMALAVSVLHGPTRPNGTEESNAQGAKITHMDIRPDHFCVYKTSGNVMTGCRYIVKLIGVGCAVDGNIRLDSIPDRKRADCLISSTTLQMYRAPEMVDILLADELNHKVDIWALGCCLYGLLFLKDCFQDKSKLQIVTGSYEVPGGHPYNDDVLDLVSRMLEVDAKKRPDIHEVISCVDSLTSDKSLPTRRRNPAHVSNHTPSPQMALIKPNDSRSPTPVILPHRSQSLINNADAQLCWSCHNGSLDSNSNVGTDKTQWLEFVPISTNESCVRRLAQPIRLASFTNTSEILQKHRTCPQALNGSHQRTTGDKTEARVYAWNLDLFKRQSFRSVHFIDDADTSEDDDHPNSLRAPSIRDIRDYGVGPVHNKRIDRKLTVLSKLSKRSMLRIKQPKKPKDSHRLTLSKQPSEGTLNTSATAYTVRKSTVSGSSLESNRGLKYTPFLPSMRLLSQREEEAGKTESVYVHHERKREIAFLGNDEYSYLKNHNKYQL